MSALSLAPAPASGVRWAHPLTPLDSALTDCCLSYKQNAAVSPLESALTNASHLLDSTCFETACFDTLAQTSPASPLESALTKTPGVGVSQHFHASSVQPQVSSLQNHMRHVALPPLVASVDCAY